MPLLFILLLLLPAASKAAPASDTGLNGTWWNSSQDGQGFVIHLIPDSNQVFLAWFTFAPEGEQSPGSQLWLTGSGTLDANPINLELTLTRGGGLNAAQPAPQNEQWGTATLEFISCTEGRFEYEGQASGTVELQRLTPVVSCQESAR